MMKRYLTIALLALAACKGNTGNNNKTGNDSGKLSTAMVDNPRSASGIDTVSAAMKPTMDFKDSVHDFGSIHQGEVISHEFTFTNSGKSPLLISSASASCGCTVADYPHDPIPPGKSGVMKVTFNSTGKGGHQEKSITIHTNTVKSIQMIYIKGEVIVPKSKDGLQTY